MLKIRRSNRSSYLNMGIPMTDKDGLYIETGPRITSLLKMSQDLAIICLTQFSIYYTLAGPFKPKRLKLTALVVHVMKLLLLNTEYQFYVLVDQRCPASLQLYFS